MKQAKGGRERKGEPEVGNVEIVDRKRGVAVCIYVCGRR
jgi:hypothetical protein